MSERQFDSRWSGGAVGDLAEVWSHSAQAWVRGEITRIESEAKGPRYTLNYDLEGVGTCQKALYVTSQHVRPLQAPVPPATKDRFGDEGDQEVLPGDVVERDARSTSSRAAQGAPAQGDLATEVFDSGADRWVDRPTYDKGDRPRHSGFACPQPQLPENFNEGLRPYIDNYNKDDLMRPSGTFRPPVRLPEYVNEGVPKRGMLGGQRYDGEPLTPRVSRGKSATHLAPVGELDAEAAVPLRSAWSLLRDKYKLDEVGARTARSMNGKVQDLFLHRNLELRDELDHAEALLWSFRQCAEVVGPEVDVDNDTEVQDGFARVLPWLVSGLLDEGSPKELQVLADHLTSLAVCADRKVSAQLPFAADTSTPPVAVGVVALLGARAWEQVNNLDRVMVTDMIDRGIRLTTAEEASGLFVKGRIPKLAIAKSLAVLGPQVALEVALGMPRRTLLATFKALHERDEDAAFADLLLTVHAALDEADEAERLYAQLLDSELLSTGQFVLRVLQKVLRDNDQDLVLKLLRTVPPGSLLDGFQLLHEQDGECGRQDAAGFVDLLLRLRVSLHETDLVCGSTLAETMFAAMVDAKLFESDIFVYLMLKKVVERSIESGRPATAVKMLQRTPEPQLKSVFAMIRSKPYKVASVREFWASLVQLYSMLEHEVPQEGGLSAQALSGEGVRTFILDATPFTQAHLLDCLLRAKELIAFVVEYVSAFRQQRGTRTMTLAATRLSTPDSLDFGKVPSLLMEKFKSEASGAGIDRQQHERLLLDVNDACMCLAFTADYLADWGGDAQVQEWVCAWAERTLAQELADRATDKAMSPHLSSDAVSSELACGERLWVWGAECGPWRLRRRVRRDEDCIQKLRMYLQFCGHPKFGGDEGPPVAQDAGSTRVQTLMRLVDQHSGMRPPTHWSAFDALAPVGSVVRQQFVKDMYPFAHARTALSPEEFGRLFGDPGLLDKAMVDFTGPHGAHAVILRAVRDHLGSYFMKLLEGMVKLLTLGPLYLTSEKQDRCHRDFDKRLVEALQVPWSSKERQPPGQLHDVLRPSSHALEPVLKQLIDATQKLTPEQLVGPAPTPGAPPTPRFGFAEWCELATFLSRLRGRSSPPRGLTVKGLADVVERVLAGRDPSAWLASLRAELAD